MQPLKAEPNGIAVRRRGPPDRRGAFPMVLTICLMAMLTACALGPVASDSDSATDIREAMTTDDRHIAAMAVQIAMERRVDNVASTWSNALSGNHGAVVPRRSYRSQAGAFCRQYDEVITVAGIAATYERAACRDGLGRWTTVT